MPPIPEGQIREADWLTSNKKLITSNKCIATSNKGITTSSEKLPVAKGITIYLKHFILISAEVHVPPIPQMRDLTWGGKIDLSRSSCCIWKASA